MAEFDVPPERTLMIGDTTHDLLMARNAGVAAVGVCFGAHEAEALAQLEPLALLRDTASLQAWLLDHA
jgi:phosphoglycolate phosphatase